MSPEPRALVSIVIPFYSHPEYLTQALESALGQTYPAIEVLLVDDGSPHDLDPILQPYQRDARLRVIHQENAGVAAARNTGIAASRGVYLQFLDSDDWLAPEKIERHLAALEAAPAVGLVFCPFHFVEGDTISEPVNPPTVHDTAWEAGGGRYFNTLWAANRMVVAGPLVRRAWIERAGGFETANLTEDYELWLRLAAMGCLFQNLPDALVYYRVNKQGRSQDGRARTRKVATRARILTLYPEQVAEATERAMETWTDSFDRLRAEHNGVLLSQASSHATEERQREDIARLNEQLAQVTQERDTLRERSGAQQEALDQLTAEYHSLQARSQERSVSKYARRAARKAARALGIQISDGAS